MKRKPSHAKQGAMVRRCERFNDAHPVHSKIMVWPGRVGVGILASVKVVKPGAYVLGGHTAVVQVTGGHGCISLDHVEGET